MAVQMSAFLVTAWEALAKKHDADSIWEFPVEFLDVQILMPVPVQPDQQIILGVAFNFSNGFQA